MITNTIKQAGLVAFAVAAISVTASMAGTSSASAAGLSSIAPISNVTSDTAELVVKVRGRRAGRGYHRGGRHRGGRRWRGHHRGGWVRLNYGGRYGCYYKRKRVWSNYYGEYILKRVRRCY